MRYEIRLAGSGGQGLILAGIILAEALALQEDRHVVQTESFGPEARGGASKCDIIFSDKEIFYPKARKFDLLLALSQKACDEYSSDITTDGVLLVDAKYVKKYLKRGISFPFSQVSKEYLNTELFANIIALGVISAISKIVTTDELASVLPSRVPKAMIEANLRALNLGRELVKPSKNA